MKNPRIRSRSPRSLAKPSTLVPSHTLLTSTILRPKLIVNVLPSRHSLLPNWQYFRPTQFGAHLYMPALYTKLLMNMLPGTHSLHPKLVHNSLFSSTPNWCPSIHACPPPEADTEPSSWHAFPSPQTGYTKPM